MDKERLGRLKHNVLPSIETGGGDERAPVSVSDSCWLISTIEQQQLEIDGLRKAGKFFENGYCQYEEENIRLREALSFYANKENYRETGEYWKIVIDEGEKARKALEG